MTIAVDFDGTIVENRYPEIGRERPFAVETLRMLVAEGHQLVLWSCREGQLLDEALAWCRERGLEFWAVNRDYPEETQQTNPHWTRKLKADLFIDDRNVGGLPDWGTIYQMIKGDINDNDNENENSFRGGVKSKSIMNRMIDYMKNKNIVMMLLAAVLLTACGSTKNVAYLKNSNLVDLSQSQYLYDAKIMPKDVLSITVTTTNPAAAAPFNLSVYSSLSGSANATMYSNHVLQSYLVDNGGNIDFPVIGQLHVGGLTKSECEAMIYGKIKPYMNEKENPVVTVRMANYKISVLGEVRSPGMYTVGNEKINILEALAQAGDLTIYGVRDRVKLIREDEHGGKKIYTLNLNDANLITSPYYYLQQNDIVYVEPNKVSARNASIGQSTSLWLTSTGILISLTSLLYSILR